MCHDPPRACSAESSPDDCGPNQLTLFTSPTMLSHSKLFGLNKPFFAAHSRIPLRVMASTNGVAGTNKGHEQANTLLEKAQDLGQKVAGAAGATVDKTVRPAPCT